MFQAFHLELLYKRVLDEIPGNNDLVGRLPIPAAVPGYHTCSFKKIDGIPGLFECD
jgi:hypothetical protein